MKYLAHEARRGRNAGERKHEDEEKNRSGGAALVEAVEVVQFVADDAALPEHDDYGKGTMVMNA